MDIDKLIADEMVRERALYERVRDWEREMEPLKLRMEAAREQWSQSYNQIKVLAQLKAFLAARETAENATGDDAAVLAADRRKLAALPLEDRVNVKIQATADALTKLTITQQTERSSL